MKEQYSNTIKIIEPKFVVATAFLTKHFKAHLLSIKVDRICEKPLHIEAL